VERAGLEPRQVQQARRELAEAVDLLVELAEEAFARLVVEVLVLEQLEEAAEREDRRAQLVRRGCDEPLAGVLELGELALHVVQRARQAAELVAGPALEAAGEVAPRDAASGGLHARDAARELPRGRPAQQDRQRERDPPGHEDPPAD